MISVPTRIELFGGLQVRQDDRVISRFQTVKTGALLAYLAMHPQRTFSREAVAEMLWPDGDSTAVRNRLNQAVSSLRRQLHPPGSSQRAVIMADHHGVSINADAVTTDVAEFETAVRTATSSRDHTVIAENYTVATELYKGDLLEGINEPWAALDRVRFRDSYLEALTWLIKHHVERHEYADAIRFAQQRVLAEPLLERNHRTLMRLYLKLGRPSSALAHYDEFSRQAKIHDRPISAKVSMLREQAELLSNAPGSASQDVLAPKAAKPRLSAIVDAPLPLPTVAPARETPSYPALPVYLSKWVGRERELELVTTYLGQSGVRFVTLVGVSGMGKTRLAAEAAHQLSDFFGKRIAFANLLDLDPTRKIADLISHTLLPELASGMRSAHDLANIPANEPRLVILDNAETMSPGQQLELQEVLQRAPGVRIIATSFFPLSLEGEHVITIEPLPLPHYGPTATLADLASNPCVALFVSRAQAAKHDFQLTERIAEAVVRICRRLGGYPLALELAASWTRNLTPAKIAEEVSANLSNLNRKGQDEDDRRHSVSAAIQSTIAGLSKDSLDALTSLASIRGEFTLEIARRMIDGDCLASLRDLQDRTLVLVREDDEETRYYLLPVVRRYLAESENTALNEFGHRHARVYSELARDVIRRSTTEISDFYWHSRMDLQAAFRFWEKNHRYAEAMTVGVLLQAMSAILHDYGFGIEFSNSLEALAGKEFIPPQLIARYLGTLGYLHQLAGDVAEADALLRQSVELFDREKIDDFWSVVMRINRAVVRHRQGHPDQALECFTESIPAVERLRDWRLSARLHLVRGHSLCELEQWDEAEKSYANALRISRDHKDPVTMNAVVSSLANLYSLQGRFEAAYQTLVGDQSSPLIQTLSRAFRTTLARILLRLGHYKEALEHLQQSWDPIGPVVYQDWSLGMDVAKLFSDLGKWPQAASMLGFVLEGIEHEGLTVHGQEGRYFEEIRARLYRELGKPETDDAIALGRFLGKAQVGEMLRALQSDETVSTSSMLS